jgi:hypothetical protein
VEELKPIISQELPISVTCQMQVNSLPKAEWAQHLVDLSILSGLNLTHWCLAGLNLAAESMILKRN